MKEAMEWGLTSVWYQAASACQYTGTILCDNAKMSANDCSSASSTASKPATRALA